MGKASAGRRRRAGRGASDTPGWESNAQNREALLRAIFETTPVCVKLLARDGTLLEMNPAGLAIIEADSREQVIGRPLYPLVAPAHREAFRALVGRVFAGESGTLEFEIVGLKGTRRWVESHAVPLHGDGDVAALLAVTRDVTERRRVQETLRDSHDRLRALIEASPVAIYSLDPDGVVQTWHPAAERMFGWRAEEVVGRFLPIVPEHKREEFAALRARAMRGESLADIEVRRQRRDGSPIDISIWTSPLHDAAGKVTGIMAVVTDITERKQAEEQLRLRTEELEVLMLTGQALSQLTAPTELLQLIYAAVGQVLDNRNLFIALYDEASQSISFPVYIIDGRPHRASSRPFGNGATEYVIRTRAPLLIPRDVTAVLRARGADIIGREARSFLAVPMLIGDKAIGVICVQDYEREETYTARHAEILSTFASQAAVALDNARLYDMARRELAERRAAEQRLRLQATALEAAANAIVITDRDGTIQWVNPAFTRMTGYLAEEAIGQTPRILRSGKHERAFYEQLWRTALAGETWSGELVNRRKDGSLYAEGQTITPLRDEAGEITHFISIKQDITERKEAEQQIRRQLGRLQALRNIDMAITASLDLRVTLNVILEQVTAQLQADAATVLLLDPQMQTLDYAAGRGFRTEALQHTRLRVGQGHAGRAVRERRIVSIPDLRQEPGEFDRAPRLAGEEFIAYHAAPLVAKGQVKGVLELFHRAPLDPDPQWLDFLEALATQAAIAIDNAGLFDGLERANVDLMLAYDTTLEGWGRALELRDKETEGHTQRVADLTVCLARALRVRDEDLLHVRRGALLHDIGKMGIPDTILLKPGPLTDEEWAVMKQHPTFAYELLAPIDFLRPALEIPYAHHEKWDGTGYPRGLKGEQIPASARIFAVVDVWDALRSDRPYRQAWTDEQARQYIREQAGKHFDPQVVEAFLRLVEKEEV